MRVLLGLLVAAVATLGSSGCLERGCAHDEQCRPSDHCDLVRMVCVPGPPLPDAGPTLDGGADDAGAGDAAVLDAGGDVDGGTWDSGAPDGGVRPLTLEGLEVTFGRAQLESASRVLDVQVGGPIPSRTLANSSYRLELGVAAPRPR